MNNIPVCSNNDNTQNKVNKPSKKKKILKVVLIVLVAIWVFNTLAQLFTHYVSAYDNEKVNLLNSVIYIDESDIVSEPYDGEIVTPYSTRAILDVTNETWAGELTTYNNAQFSRTYFPDFKVTPTNIPNIGGYTTNFCVYLGFVFSSNVSNITHATFGTDYIKAQDGYQSNSGLFYYTYFGAGENICIIALPLMGNTQSVCTFYTPSIYMLNSVVGYVDYEFGSVGTSAVEVIENCIQYRDGASSEDATTVNGTDEFTISTPSEGYKNYLANDILFPWDVGYFGFIGRVKTADGQTVPVLYKLMIDGLMISEGEYVILDPNYQLLTMPVTIYGGQTNDGMIEFTVSDTMEVVYMAVSNDMDLLNEHLLSKVQKYQLILDEINNAFADGYAQGVKDGAESVQIGVFGNALMEVTYSISDMKHDIPYTETIYLPINVSTGGIDFTNVWNYYYNSTWYRPNYFLYNIEINIIFEDGFLWSNDILFWKLTGDNVNIDMLPYDAYLFTIEDTNQLFTLSYEQRGNSFYLIANENLANNSVSNIVFNINTEHMSIYDFLVTYNSTLYNNIQNWGINQTSYDKGHKDGLKIGKENGFNLGKEEGYKEGYDEAKYEYYEKGYDTGYHEGYDVGHYNGREEGMNESFNFYLIPTSIIDAISGSFFGWLDFEFFGVNMASFVLQLMTIAVFAWIWKKVA